MTSISVCLALYNGEKYIKEQLDSIIIQLPEEGEIIISDDGSSDNSINIINAFNDNRIKVIRNNSRHGVIHNFENALSNASGLYIFLCDQDDVWLPNKISTFEKYLNNYDLVVSDCKVVDKDLNIINESFFNIINSQKGFFRNLYKNGYLGCCMGFNKKILKCVLPFPRNIAMHDIWIGLCAELYGNPIFIKEQLSLYRRHGDNESCASEKSIYSLSFKIRYRLYMLIHLVLRYFRVK